MTDRDDINTRHRLDPKVGDYWHEMFSGIMVVVGRTEDAVIVCDKKRSTPDGGWFWDTTTTRKFTLEEFSAYPTYVGLSPTSIMKDKCWCDVVPESQKGVRDLVMQSILGDAN